MSSWRSIRRLESAVAEMAGTKEIKTRIQSVQETKKITSAMYLIASTKLRRARQEAKREVFGTNHDKTGCG